MTYGGADEILHGLGMRLPRAGGYSVASATRLG
jgi:hypothetical protein